jgi:outer membrane protein OmpA-like peptidoglycan-associated protein
MRTGDDAGVLAVCGETTTVSAENMGWSCRGRDEIHAMLDEIRDRFPDLTFESRTRHIGFGLVIDEARVQDLRAVDDEGAPTEAADEAPPAEDTAARHAAEPDPAVHPMWDEPVAEKRAGLTLWRETYADHVTPSRLNMPVRVTVRHDDLQVHDVTLSFPAALLKRALGMHVDPFEMSLSEVQSAFIAPVGAGFATYELARPELALVPPAPEPERWESEGDEPTRKRRRRLVPVLLLLLAIIAAGGWWAVQGRGGDQVADQPTHSPSVKPHPQPSASVAPSTDATKAPTVTHAPPSEAPSRKPTVTLTSDLAFDKNSAALSSAAKSKIDEIAAQVKSAGLSGNIYVNGYTDNLGSAKSGITLSRQRADAVSHYLGSQLVGVPVSIVVVANGEKDPVASNDTEAGRAKNRRVTITLPKP